MRPLVFAAVLLIALPLFGDCVGNGHYTVVGSASPLAGSRFPYTEDLVHHSTDLPVGEHVEIAYHDDLHWTKIQSGCASFAEQNVHASVPVNLMLRASLRISVSPRPTAPASSRYEVQLRLGTSMDDPEPRIVATELRRVGSQVPRAERFSALVRDLPAGSYVYSMWVRLLDGPPSNAFYADLQWITAQGVPSEFPAAEETVDRVDVGSEWTAVGDPLLLGGRQPADVALQSSFVIERASDGASKLSIAFTTDGAEAGGDYGTIAIPAVLPEGSVAFDDARALSPARHPIQLWMRSDAGSARVTSVRIGALSMPLRQHVSIIPTQHASASDPVVITAQGDPVQPAAMSPICGAWTKVLEFEMTPSRTIDNFSWTMNGYVEITGVDTSGYGQVGVVIEHRRNSAAEGAADFDEATDIGMFELQARPGGDGIYFYGDCSKWGNKMGNRVSVWVRRIAGCADSPMAGTLFVGKRWVSVKLLPSVGPLLP